MPTLIRHKSQARCLQYHRR